MTTTDVTPTEPSSAAGGAGRPLDVAFLVFESMTALDFVGPWDTIAIGAKVSRRPVRLHLVSADPGPVTCDSGLQVVPTATLEQVRRCDVLVVPGTGRPSRPMSDSRLVDWLRATHPHATWTMSVCTGALLLAQAGLLRGRAATTSWQYLDDLAAFGALPRDKRWVRDGNVLTSAGVSAGIDAAHVLVEALWGESTVASTQAVLEYDPAPPFDYGSIDKLPPEAASALRAVFETERDAVRRLASR
ncbi:DJ-1/PfpI family protein [Plantactinospora sp. GCM10030261]|uniref:DJ-1/PfpI family protein n=1 Tax=Plantactinospora sp. GCM10030261 TaxID=3273420 RepID=UPI00360F8289